MQTFKGRMAFDFTAVITRDFLAEARKEAQAEDATPFLKACQANHPEDDDQFMLAVVCNAVRSQTRYALLDFFQGSGVGGSVSPLEVLHRECAVPAVFSETPPGEPVERVSKKDTLVLGFDPGIPESAAQREAVVVEQGI